MEVPRRLYTTETGEICEEGDPRARFLLSAKGGVIAEAEAQRIGLLQYLAQGPADAQTDAPTAKMVEQAAVEDKAVGGPTEAKADEPPAELPPEPAPEEDAPQTGAQLPPETRRTGGGRRGA